MRRPIGVLVDAYSTGNYFPAAFDRLGVDVTHLQSTSQLLPSMLPPARHSYQDFLVFDSEETAIKEVKELSPLFVLAGQELGGSAG
ncbi:MAG: hypothetical protein ABI047_09330 [Jatrophihabitantaceae bacterium]